MRGCGLLLLAAALRGCLACTYFELNTTGAGKEVVIGRTMEFDKVLTIKDWRLHVKPRDVTLDFGVNATVQKQGFLCGKYRSPAKYAYIGIVPNFAGLGDVEVEGMNEKGLACSVQTQYRAEYPSCKSLGNKSFVSTRFFCRWVLANFETVAQVRDAVQHDVVVSNEIGMGIRLPKAANIHWAIADAQGGSIVVEYERGEPKIYNNLVGVLTNDPFYPWHVENLNTYSWLSASADQNERAKAFAVPTDDLLPGQTEVPFNGNHGYNTGGLPGDPSPRSRFVRAFFLRQISQLNSKPDGDGLWGWYSLAQAILNHVFIPMGFTGEDPFNPLIKGDNTNWATLRVPQTRFFAFRSYFDMQWKVVDLTRLDFTRELNLPLPHQGSATEGSLNMADITDDVNGGAVAGLLEKKAAAARRSFLQKPQAGDESAFFQTPWGRDEI